MIYATQINMTDRFGETEIVQISDKDVHLNVINVVRVNAALADASNFIDLYLSKCYALPLLNLSPYLIHLCCDIARYYMYDSIRLSSSNDFEDHESARRYRQAVKTLESICKINLVDNLGQTIPKKLVSAISVTKNKSCIPCPPCCGDL